MLQGSQARQGSGTPRQRIQPGRWLYIVAAAALALGTLLGVLSLVGLVSALSGSTTKVVAPGETEITLPAAGAYTINYEYQTVVDGRTFNTPPEFPSMKLELISTTSGTHVPIRASSVQSTYEVGSTKGAAIGEFTVDRPGTYVLTSQYSGGETAPEVVLAIGRGSPGTVLFTIFGIFGAIGLLLVSLVIGLATLILRMTAKQRVRSAGMLTAPAEASGGCPGQLRVSNRRRQAGKRRVPRLRIFTSRHPTTRPRMPRRRCRQVSFHLRSLAPARRRSHRK